MSYKIIVTTTYWDGVSEGAQPIATHIIDCDTREEADIAFSKLVGNPERLELGHNHNGPGVATLATKLY